jgi:hypothetical protein
MEFYQPWRRMKSYHLQVNGWNLLSKVSQAQKTKNRMFSLICRLYLFFIFYYSFIYMCIHWVIPPPAPAPILLPLPLHFQAEPVLPLSLILLKRRHSIIRKTKRFC